MSHVLAAHPGDATDESRRALRRRFPLEGQTRQPMYASVSMRASVGNLVLLT